MLLRPVCPACKEVYEGQSLVKARNQGHSTGVSHPASSEAPACRDRTRDCGPPGGGDGAVVLWRDWLRLKYFRCSG